MIVHDDQLIDRAALNRAMERIAHLEVHEARVVTVARAGAQISLFGNHHRDGLVGDRLLGDGLLGLFQKRSAVVAELLGRRIDFLGDETLEGAWAREHALERSALAAELRELLLDRDRSKAGELTQADLKNVLGLTVRELELADERRLRVVRRADDLDDAVDVEQHERTAFQHVDAVEHLVEPRLRPPADGLETEFDPFAQNLKEILLLRLPVDAEHDEVHRDVRLKVGLRKEHVDEFAPIDAARLRLEDEPHGHVTSRFVPHTVQKREHGALGLLLRRRKRLLALLRLRIRDRLNAVENALRACRGRKLIDDKLPLTA